MSGQHAGRWWSQPFAPEGSAAAEGIAKQLGRPLLDPLTILVREAAQNSWDARRPGVVDFRISIRPLGEYSQAWQDSFLPAPPEESGMTLAEHLGPESIVLTVSDRNTGGLGGPLRAGERAKENEHADFVQFLRNVGEPSDHKFGGGTYGFGKGIFYRLSKAGTVLVSTHTAGGEGEERRRLMGAALGHSWYQQERRYTGRHWWGSVAEDNVPDPLLGPDGSELARRLGLPDFAADETGTDIVVIGADLGTVGQDQGTRSRTTSEAATFLMSSILWHLWPKFIPDDNGDVMRFFVGTGEKLTAVPSPARLPEFKPFVAALKEVRGGRGKQYTRTVPPKNAGAFHLTRFLNDADKPSRAMITEAMPFSGPVRHVARMRAPELVVDYFEGPADPDNAFAYAAVFKASTDADQAFADSEPPTHDAWIATGLSGAPRGVVGKLNSRILKWIDDELGPAVSTGDSDSSGLGNFSMRLASLIPSVGLNGGSSEDDHDDDEDDRTSGGGDGGSASGRAGPGRKPPARGRRSSAPRLVGEPKLQVHNGAPFLVAKVFVPESVKARILAAEVKVVLDGGAAENDTPLGATVPEINQWQPVAGGPAIAGPRIYLSAGADSEWWLYASHVPDAVVRFRVQEVRDHAG
ncbi:hypothetical protein [Kineosporia sp. NBRC 101731]|uniref:hypothetical protein n=1 Tax=Kineosporia sp. NBRC 101731 TaxID=3032199 RepID=UPI0024A00DBE|nr:hypothetical protein [Kineosporia sp. NBRC 101731]GLY31598.1 hypothetical protein Kisp02_49630 [Kineosporia sp. NBRC 101731]